MLAKYKTRQRHQKLMRVAHHLLKQAYLYRSGGTADVTAQDVVAYAFGCHQLEIDLDEAQKFLDAARVSRGETAPQAAA
ncbi:hypothetical protein [Streptomyces lydicus]|uniref:hypothetical protein n=1 Tax=Streptomyces lydicus TaxID=47763 RepID=UPI0038261582